MSDEGGNFLSRWSRRKTEARRAEDADIPSEPATVRAPAAAAPPDPKEEISQEAARLPSVEELHGLESEYRDFLRPDVDESLRRSALKKLFHDPHFNQMDGLDTYIDDYTNADPIPEAMLRTLNQAKGLVFDREKEEVESGAEPDPAPVRSAEPEAEATLSDESGAVETDGNALREPPVSSGPRPS